jgi:hypothetical protein
MSALSVREVRGCLRVVRNARDHWCVQGLGDLSAAVRLPLTDDDQAQISAIGGAEPPVITKC